MIYRTNILAKINFYIQKYRRLPVQIKASFWFLVCSFLQKGISMITTPIFTRIMSTSDYGAYGEFNSWYGIISIIVALSLTGGVHTQGLIKFDKEKEVFSSSLQGLTIVLICFWFAIYLLFRNSFNSLLSLSSTQMVSMFVIIWVTSVFGFWANEQRVKYSYKILVVVTLISSIIKPLLEIYLVYYSNDKATARIIGWAIADFFIFSWMFVSQLKNGKVFFSKRFWKYALLYNLPLVPHYLSQSILNSSDRIMIGRIIGESEAGIYNLAYSLSMIMTLFNTALMQTISPWMYKKIKERKEKEISSVAYMTLVLIACVNLFLILLAPEAVAIFAPKAYYDAIYVIPPVAMSVFFMYAYDLFAKFAFYYEKTNAIMLASVSGAALNVVLNYFLLKRFGYIAAGYTTLICFIEFTIVHYFIMKKICDRFCDSRYPYNTRILLLITLPFLFLGFLFLATYSHPVVRYGIVVVLIIVLVIFRNMILSFLNGLLDLKK